MRNPNTHKSYYMYGIHPVLCALKNPKRYVHHILCTKRIFDQHSASLSQFKYEVVSNNNIDKIIGIGCNHQGIILKTDSIFLNTIQDLYSLTHNNSERINKVAILDQITDPQNIGAIIRSAAAFGIEAIILPQDNTPSESGVIAKTACGALEVVKIVRVVNLRNSIEYLKKQGFWVIGLDVEAKSDLTNNHSILSNKTAIILGSEDKGLRPLTKKHCDFLIKIPMVAEIESLNVANAAAIIFYLLYTNSSN